MSHQIYHEEMRMKTVIVAAPQGAGKTLAAPLLLQQLGLSRVVDDWWPGEQPLQPDALHLSHMHPDDARQALTDRFPGATLTHGRVAGFAYWAAHA